MIKRLTFIKNFGSEIMNFFMWDYLHSYISRFSFVYQKFYIVYKYDIILFLYIGETHFHTQFKLRGVPLNKLFIIIKTTTNLYNFEISYLMFHSSWTISLTLLVGLLISSMPVWQSIRNVFVYISQHCNIHICLTSCMKDIVDQNNTASDLLINPIVA